MSQSLANVLVHIVFSTKGRQAVFQDIALRDEMHRYLAGVSQSLDCPVIRVGGVADHVHLLARQARTITLAEWIKELKRVSAIWLKARDANFESFQWQLGYGAFSVSQSQSAVVDKYIAEQERHHKTLTFQDEFRGLLKKHNIEYDERYVWD
jgi:REP element-mobilizing transposase RayT